MANINKPPNLTKIQEPLATLLGNQGFNYQVYDLLPIPMEVFIPDGTAIFANQAMRELKNAPDAFMLVDKFNLRDNPLCLEILGQEKMDKIFRGETCCFPDIAAPLQNLTNRGPIFNTFIELTTVDLSFLPIWDGDAFLYTIVFFTIKNKYHGRDDIAKAQEYIRQNWLDKFDLYKTAQVTNLSPRHFQRLFKEVAGITPSEYYQNIKIEKIREKLLSDRLSIEQVFTDCNVEYRGVYLKLFKEKFSMSPSEYRKDKLNK